MATQFVKIHQLNWNLLRTFLVIVEERSITRAADRLMIRQPSASAALQRLEETLGSQLIERDSRRFVLTRKGELLHRECLEIFRSVKRIGERLAEAHDQLTGSVRIMTVTQLVLPSLDCALGILHRRHPSVSVRIDVASSQEIVRAVSQKLTPFGFCLLPKPLAGLDCRLLMREQFGVFCGEGHRLFGRSDVTLDELRDEPFIALACGEEGGTLEPMTALRDGVGLGFRTVGSSPHLVEVQRMILAGMGIGILPLLSAHHVIETRRLWRLPPLGDVLGADLYLVTNPAMEPSPADTAFDSILRASIDLDGDGSLSPLSGGFPAPSA